MGKWAVYAIKVFCAVVVVVASAFTVFTAGPAIETRFFPAVSKLHILQLSADDAGMAVVQAEFTKLRDCEYVGISWYYWDKGRNGFERVPVILMRKDGDTSSPNRPTGTQRAGPWIVGVPPADLEKFSFARLAHRCHPFWLTTTEFYP